MTMCDRPFAPRHVSRESSTTDTPLAYCLNIPRSHRFGYSHRLFALSRRLSALPMLRVLTHPLYKRYVVRGSTSRLLLRESSNPNVSLALLCTIAYKPFLHPLGVCQMETGFPPGYSYVGGITGLVPSMDLVHPSACNWGVRSLLLPPHNPLLIAPLRSEGWRVWLSPWGRQVAFRYSLLRY